MGLVGLCQAKLPLKDDFESLDQLTRERLSHFRIEGDDEDWEDDVVEHQAGDFGHVEPQLALERQEAGDVATCHFPDSARRHHADGAERDDDEDVAVADDEVAAVVKLVVGAGAGSGRGRDVIGGNYDVIVGV